MNEELSEGVSTLSNEQEISDIEDQELSLPELQEATPITTNVSSPIISQRPTVVLSSPSSLFFKPAMSQQSSSTGGTGSGNANAGTTSNLDLGSGLTVRVSNTANAQVGGTEFVQITSEDRVQLSAKEQNDIRHTITRKQHSVYNKMDLASTDLNELVGLQTNLETTERHFAKFDIKQVFMIVDPQRGPDGEVLPSLKAGTQPRSLFQWYAVLRVEEIVASSQWWRKFLPDPWYQENMGLTYEYLRNHTSESLWMKVNEEYNTYPVDAKGGPLCLFLMIRQLMADNDSIARSLADKIKTVKITDYKGEDVGQVVTHLRAIIHRLKNMRRRDASGNEVDLVPFDLSRDLYMVFQTSTNAAFNRLFETKCVLDQATALIGGQTKWTDPETILVMAGNFYVQLSSENKWSGVDQNKATFPSVKNVKEASSFLSRVKCHNCGGPHFLRECTEQRDQARIDANAKKMEEARKLVKKDKKGKNKSGKGFAPGGKFPDKPKKGQPQRCTVDGKEYYFHYKTGRWLLVDRQVNVASTPAATNTSTSNGSNLASDILRNRMNEAFAAFESSMSRRD